MKRKEKFTICIPRDQKYYYYFLSQPTIDINYLAMTFLNKITLLILSPPARSR